MGSCQGRSCLIEMQLCGEMVEVGLVLWLLQEQWQDSICLGGPQAISLGIMQSCIQTELQIWA